MLLSLGFGGLRVLLYWGIAAGVGLLSIVVISLALLRHAWSSERLERRSLAVPYPKSVDFFRRVRVVVDHQSAKIAELLLLFGAALALLLGVAPSFRNTWSWGLVGKFLFRNDHKLILTGLLAACVAIALKIVHRMAAKPRVRRSVLVSLITVFLGLLAGLAMCVTYWITLGRASEALVFGSFPVACVFALLAWVYVLVVSTVVPDPWGWITPGVAAALLLVPSVGMSLGLLFAMSH